MGSNIEEAGVGLTSTGSGNDCCWAYVVAVGSRAIMTSSSSSEFSKGFLNDSLLILLLLAHKLSQVGRLIG